MTLDLFGIKIGENNNDNNDGYIAEKTYKIPKHTLLEKLGFKSENIKFISYDYKKGILELKGKWKSLRTEEKKMTQPKKKYRAGQISVTVWENTRKDNEGKEYTTDSYQVTKSYKDDKDEWKETNNLQLTDLPKLISLLQTAYAEGLIKTE